MDPQHTELPKEAEDSTVTELYEQADAPSLLLHPSQLGPKARHRLNRRRSLATLKLASNDGIYYAGDPRADGRGLGSKRKGDKSPVLPNSPVISSPLSPHRDLRSEASTPSTEEPDQIPDVAQDSRSKEGPKDSKRSKKHPIWDEMELEVREDLLPSIDSQEAEDLTGMTEDAGLDAANQYDAEMTELIANRRSRTPQDQEDKPSTGSFQRPEPEFLSPDQKKAAAEKLVRERVLFAFEQQCLAADQHPSLSPRKRLALFRTELEHLDITSAYLHKYRHNYFALGQTFREQVQTITTLSHDLAKLTNVSSELSTLKEEWSVLAREYLRSREAEATLSAALDEADEHLKFYMAEQDFSTSEILRLREVNDAYGTRITEMRAAWEREVGGWRRCAEANAGIAEEAMDCRAELEGCLLRERRERKRDQEELLRRRGRDLRAEAVEVAEGVLRGPSAAHADAAEDFAREPAARLVALPRKNRELKRKMRALFGEGGEGVGAVKNRRERWVRNSPVYLERMAELRSLREVEGAADFLLFY